MARTVFLAGGGAWFVLGAVGVALAVAGREWIVATLPPLAVDTDAIGGALTAVALAALAVGAAHLAIAAGLAGDRRWARSAGILLASMMALAFLGATAAAASSAVRESALVLPLGASAVVAGLAVIAYGLTAVLLVREIGAGPGI